MSRSFHVQNDYKRSPSLSPLQPHLYKSISSTFNKIVAEEGLGALYSGLRPSVLGVFPYAAANYGVYAGLRSAYKRVTKKDYVPTVPTLLFGAAAASCSSALTFPLEVSREVEAPLDQSWQNFQNG